MRRILNDNYLRRTFLLFCDAGLVYFTYYLVVYLRCGLVPFFTDIPPLDLRNFNADFIALIVFGLPFGLSILREYESPSKVNGVQFAGLLFKVLVLVTLTVATLSLVLKWHTVSRFILFGTVGGAGVLIFIRHLIIRQYLKHRKLHAANKERVLYVGSDEEINTFIAKLSDEEALVIEHVKSLPLNSSLLTDLEEITSELAIERVVFVSSEVSLDQLNCLINVCESLGVKVWLVSDVFSSSIAKPSVSSVGGVSLLIFSSTPEMSWSLVFKAFFDRIGAFLGLLLAAIPIAVAIVIIKINDPKGSAFFKQKRAGKYGHPFKMWKLRTMYVDAEAKLAELKQTHGNEMSGPVFKLTDDPRVIPGGHFLRRTSIDELPQLINVLLGDMSLVGPRPLPLYEVELFKKPAHRRRLSVKPGITCTWQAGGRNEITSFEDWVKMDLDYIDNWSLWLDFKLILKTIPAVLFSKGAK